MSKKPADPEEIATASRHVGRGKLGRIPSARRHDPGADEDAIVEIEAKSETARSTPRCWPKRESRHDGIPRPRGSRRPTATLRPAGSAFGHRRGAGRGPRRSCGQGPRWRGAGRPAPSWRSRQGIHAYAATHFPAPAKEPPVAADGFRPDASGENLATEADICLGDQWYPGDVLLEVSQGRQPCWKPNRAGSAFGTSPPRPVHGPDGVVFPGDRAGNSCGRWRGAPCGPSQSRLAAGQGDTGPRPDRARSRVACRNGGPSRPARELEPARTASHRVGNGRGLARPNRDAAMNPGGPAGRPRPKWHRMPAIRNGPAILRDTAPARLRLDLDQLDVFVPDT